MRNAQPTSFGDKGIKEGRLDFTTPPPSRYVQTQTHGVILQHPSIHPRTHSLKKHTT